MSIGSAVADPQTNLDNPFHLSMEQLLAVNISVASRSNMSLSEAPASVTVYSGDDIKRMGISHLEELLNYIPGYMTSREDQARLNTAVVRGRRANNYSPDILVLLDGFRLNDPVSGSAIGNISKLTLANVKQIEIIRGPGSALYGSNAFSGVINIISDNKTNQVSISGGQFSHKDAGIQFHHKSEIWQIAGFVHSYQQKGEQYPPIVDYFGHLNPTRDPEVGKEARVKLSYGQLSLSAGWIERVYRDFVQGSVVGNGANKLDRTSRYVQLNYQHQFNEDLSATAFAEHLRVTQDELILLFPGDVAATHPFGWTDGSTVDYIGGNNRFGKDVRYGFDGKWGVNPQHQLQFGAVVQQESTSTNAFQGNWDAEKLRNSDGTVRQPSTTGIQQGYWLPGGARLDLLLPYQRTIQGVYLQSQRQLNDKTQLTGGLRYDDYEDVGDNLSLRGGLVYNLGDNQNLKLLYGEAFRAPTIVDTKAEFSSATVGNPNLQPELVKTVDLIWQKAWTDFAVTANLFFNTIDDEIVVEIRQPLPGFNSLQPVNKGQQHLSGLELEMQANLNDFVALKSGLSYFHHDQTPGTASSLGFVAVNVHGEFWNWNISSYYHDKVLSRQADGVDFNQDIYLGGFAKLNSKYEYRLNDNLSLHLTADNLLDKAYRTYTTSLNLEHGLPSRGRQFSIGVDWRF